MTDRADPDPRRSRGLSPDRREDVLDRLESDALGAPLAAAAFLLGIGAWQAAVSLAEVPPILLPSPGAVALALFARERLLPGVTLDHARGELVDHASFGSFDGVLAHGAELRVMGADGALHVLDWSLARHTSISLDAAAGWLVTPPRADGAAGEIAWVMSDGGALIRVDLATGRTRQVYKMPSGASTGGMFLHDGSTAALLSDFGTLYVFRLR
jgi:hypothetical protein